MTNSYNGVRLPVVIVVSGYVFSSAFIATNGLFIRVWLLLISYHGDILFSFTELGSIVVIIVTNLMFIMSWFYEKFAVKYTM